MTEARAIGMTSTGKGKLSKAVDQLGLIDDADEAARRGRDDLFAGQRGAAALDQVQAAGGFVGAVDVDVQARDRVEVEHRNAMSREAA